jgi:hypothetical protein
MTPKASPVPPPTRDESEAPDGGGQQAKYTVMLTPRSVAALKEASHSNHETRTNVLNRGVQLYLLITRLINGGWTIIARDSEGREQQIQIL